MTSRLDLSSIDITPALSEGVKIINSYSDSYIQINNEKVEYNLLLTPESFKAYHSNQDVKEFLKSESNIIIIFGSNDEQDRINFLDFVTPYLTNLNIMIEVMSLASACRTYNVLVTEGRNVISILKLKH